MFRDRFASTRSFLCDRRPRLKREIFHKSEPQLTSLHFQKNETSLLNSESKICFRQLTKSKSNDLYECTIEPDCLGSDLHLAGSESNISCNISTNSDGHEPDHNFSQLDNNYTESNHAIIYGNAPSRLMENRDHKNDLQVRSDFQLSASDYRISSSETASIGSLEANPVPVSQDHSTYSFYSSSQSFHASNSPEPPLFPPDDQPSISSSTSSAFFESGTQHDGPSLPQDPPLRPLRSKRPHKRRAPDPPASPNDPKLGHTSVFENSLPEPSTPSPVLSEHGSADTNSGPLIDFMGKIRKSTSTNNIANIIRNKNAMARDVFFSVTQAIAAKKYFQKNSKISDTNRRLKSQIWSSVVTIVLIEGKNISVPDSDGLPDSYAKFRLGNEKYKTHVAYKTFNPNWLEQFDLHLYDDQAQELEVSVWNKAKPKDDFIGRCVIDLTELEREKTHRLKQPLDDCGGNIFLLLTISGTTASETISDLTTYEENPKEVHALHQRYSIIRTFQNLRDVGHLTVRVYKARGLASADLGGKSDPFCVLELVNARLQTQTEYKTLCPSWQKIFTFNVKDITSVLEVTVYDEDRDHKVEFLGKVAIPLLRIRNNEKRWYALKDKKLYSRAKGNFPQILLELSVIWNPIRACIRTLNPKEEKYMQPEIKFKRQVFVRNVMRLKVIIMWFIDISKFVQSCFEWESTLQSTIAFIIFVLGCYYFQPFMVPAAMILVFLKCYIVHTVAGTWSGADDDDEPFGDDEEDEDDKDKEEKKSLKERLQAIQEVTQTVQNSIGYIATLGESVKNTFNFTVPFLSYLALALLVAGTIVLYWIPVRYLILLWGVNKFARKLIRPHTIPNNEVLDLLSRVPDNEDLLKEEPESHLDRSDE